MNGAYILIENGGVVFSDELLQSFPEITATVTGNVIRVENVWREDLISIVGDNVFWTEEQAFASFSIIFTNNKASVDTLSNLLVRYVNFHDGDYSISMPEYNGNISILYDPLGLNVRPNYFAELQSYIDGNTTLQELAKVVYAMYLVILPDYDDSYGDETTIATGLATVSAIDIDKFLNSNLQALPVYETVRDNSELGTSGDKSYNLQTSSKDLVFSENSGTFDISSLCAYGEDTTELRQIILSNATTVTQCFLKSMTCDEFLNSSIENITTYFGANITFPPYGSGKKILVKIHEFGSNSELLAELIADILTVSNSSNFEALQVETYRGSYAENGFLISGTLGTYVFSNGYTELKKDWIIQTFSIAKSILDGKTDTVDTCIDKITPLSLNGVYYTYPENLISALISVSVWDGYKEQFYTCANIETIHIYNRSAGYDNGKFTVGVLSDFSFVGTPLESKITEVRIANQAEQYSLFATAVRIGLDNVYYLVSNDVEYRAVNGKGVGFSSVGSTSGAIGIIDAGLVSFDKFREDVELGISSSNRTLQVDEVSHGNLLLCSFSKQLSSGVGYFESNYEASFFIEDIVDGTNYVFANTSRYERAIMSIDVNGVPLASRDENNSSLVASPDKILNILIGNQPIVVSSKYSVRAKDLLLIKTILNVLRVSYKTSFRDAVDDSEILDTENRYAYNLLLNIYSSIFGGKRIGADGYAYPITIFSGYEKLVRLAQGEALEMDFRNSATSNTILDGNLGLNSYVAIDSAIYTISTSWVGRDSRSITFGSHGSVAGYLLLSSDANDVVVFEPTDYDSMEMGQIGLFDYTFIENELVLYLVFRGSPISVRHISMNTKTMDAYISDWVEVPSKPTTTASWGTIAHTSPIGAVASTGMYVVYTPTANGDGSVTVSYQAFDKDGNDITDQFNTLTLGETFLHKELN